VKIVCIYGHLFLKLHQKLRSILSKTDCAYNDDFVERLVEYYRGDHLILQTKYDKILTEVTLIKDYSEPIRSRLSSDEHCRTINKHTRIQNTLAECIACENEDFPTGLHRCCNYNKSVHVFGCSVEDPLSEEGCGQKINIIFQLFINIIRYLINTSTWRANKISCKILRHDYVRCEYVLVPIQGRYLYHCYLIDNKC
jgi:hypothetical protein